MAAAETASRIFLPPEIHYRANNVQGDKVDLFQAGVLILTHLLRAVTAEGQEPRLPFSKATKEDLDYKLCFAEDGCKLFLKNLAASLESDCQASVFLDQDLIELLSALIAPSPNNRSSAEELLKTSKWLSAQEAEM